MYRWNSIQAAVSTEFGNLIANVCRGRNAPLDTVSLLPDGSAFVRNANSEGGIVVTPDGKREYVDEAPIASDWELRKFPN